jgi:hypothetical protein
MRRSAGKSADGPKSEIVVKNVLDRLKIAIEETHAQIAYDGLPAVRGFSAESTAPQCPRRDR